MAKLEWDQVGTRRYEMGVDHGVLYVKDGDEYLPGVPWNGLTGIDCDDDDRDFTPLYSGNVKAAFAIDSGGVAGSVSAYTYPDEFEKCIGSERLLPGLFMQQQGHALFGLSYRTFVGDDVKGQESAFKIHLIYDMVVTKMSTSRTTLSDSPEALEFSWDFETLPQTAEGYDSYSELVFDSRDFSSEFMRQLCNILYGTEETEPRLPGLDEIIELFYVEEPVPDDWFGYPHDRVYPSSVKYPASSDVIEDGAMFLDIAVPIGDSGETELPPGESYLYSLGLVNRPINNWEIIAVDISDSSSMPEGLSFTAEFRLGDPHRLFVSVTNETENSISWTGYKNVFVRVRYRDIYER